ncbi:TonB-dependent receptor [Rhodohalobacter sp. 8-1]|uniref:TonB-dependent receptor n=1 Tax=Rhodohalobacter sp. 8-1 TaxID=3131972 RepID=UPI0030ED6D89
MIKPLPKLFLIFLVSLTPAVLLGQLRGEIRDASTDEPISFAYVHLEEINRTTTADRDGTFRFQNVPAGTYVISVHRIGYDTYSRQIDYEGADEDPIQIQMQPQNISGDEVTVTGTQDQTGGARLEHASTKIIGEELRRNLGTTLSETLTNQAGFSERSSGPAPGRPVIRGLGDERVLILRDGERTGDVSAQSADHGVSIDPMGAEEIEIARGPAALAYGANAIGGVINVVKNQIPNTVPNQFTGSASLNGKSVNSEASAALDMIVPWNNWAATLDLNGRTGQNFSTPDGSIENSYLRNTHNTAGLSYVGSKGYIGGSFSAYLSDYGIPPDPNGGHPSGVDIEMRKYQADIRGERILDHSFFKTLEARYSFVNYNHVELESNGSLGTEFGKLTTNASVKTNTNGWAIFDGGSMGIWGELQDYAARGARTPDSDLYSAAAYVIQEGDAGDLHYEVGARLEAVQSRPAVERTSSIIGDIENRSFLGLASSASLIYGLTDHLFAGTTVMHSFRAPTLEELYSEGPHLAAYSFEIGNPQLDPERGLGTELFLRYRSGRLNAELAGYRNKFQNYLFPRDTGEQSVSDPALNRFEYNGTEAEFLGFELSADLQLHPRVTVGGNLSYTRADRTVSEEEQDVTGYTEDTRPLPMIPPLKGSVFARYNRGNFIATSRVELADEQTRLAQFETKTNGYTLLNTSLQYRFDQFEMLHTVTLSGKNLLNTTYRNHLSRIKEVFPEPGRSVSLLYRLYF